MSVQTIEILDCQHSGELKSDDYTPKTSISNNQERFILNAEQRSQQQLQQTRMGWLEQRRMSAQEPPREKYHKQQALGHNLSLKVLVRLLKKKTKKNIFINLLR